MVSGKLNDYWSLSSSGHCQPILCRQDCCPTECAMMELMGCSVVGSGFSTAAGKAVLRCQSTHRVWQRWGSTAVPCSLLSFALAGLTLTVSEDAC